MEQTNASVDQLDSTSEYFESLIEASIKAKEEARLQSQGGKRLAIRVDKDITATEEDIKKGFDLIENL